MKDNRVIAVSGKGNNKMSKWNKFVEKVRQSLPASMADKAVDQARKDLPVGNWSPKKPSVKPYKRVAHRKSGAGKPLGR